MHQLCAAAALYNASLLKGLAGVQPEASLCSSAGRVLLGLCSPSFQAAQVWQVVQELLAAAQRQASSGSSWWYWHRLHLM